MLKSDGKHDNVACGMHQSPMRRGRDAGSLRLTAHPHGGVHVTIGIWVTRKIFYILKIFYERKTNEVLPRSRQTASRPKGYNVRIVRCMVKHSGRCVWTLPRVSHAARYITTETATARSPLPCPPRYVHKSAFGTFGGTWSLDNSGMAPRRLASR